MEGLAILLCAVALTDAGRPQLSLGGRACVCNSDEVKAACARYGSDNELFEHENCNQFYKCSNGRAYPYFCYSGLVYDPIHHICDWPTNVDCGSRPIVDESEVDCSEEEEDDDNYGSSSDGSDSGLSPDTGNCNCDPSEAPLICAVAGSNGTLVAHENCNQFYKCDHGVPVAITCPLGLLYNAYIGVCDWPHNVDCGDKPIYGGDNGSGNGNGGSDSGNENGDGGNPGNCYCNPGEAPGICAADGSDGTLVAHENCSQFYKCSYGVPITMNCPVGLLYNPCIECCDWPSNVECDRPVDVDGENENGNSDGGSTCNCKPEEAPALCAAEKSDGILIAHEKCNKFFKCSFGKPVAIACPGELRYNPYIERCDWPKNVDCSGKVIPDGDDNGDNENNEDTASNEDGEGENEDTCNCNPGEAPEICGAPESDGILVAHEKCDNLYKCANGVPVTLKCPETLLYKPNTQMCDWPENVECGDRIIVDENDNGGGGNGGSDGDNGSTCNCNPEEAPAICAHENTDGVLVAHEKCNKFYICAFGIPVAIQCPANLVYNPFIEVCDWPENVDCGDKPIAEIDNGENGDNDSGGDNNSTGNCDPNEAPAICAAPDSDGVLVAHENCNQFYKCANGLPVSMSCPTLLLYNPVTEQCDWPENVSCGDRVVAGGNDNEGNGADGDNEDSGDNGSNDSENGEGESGSTCNCNPGEAPEICGTPESDGVLIAHEKCDNLYKCANGLPVTLKCPETLLYNPCTQMCDWPKNVECGDRIIVDENDNGGGGNGGSDEDNGSTCNCNPEEAPAICAHENTDGVLVAHEKCNKFYICAFGIPVAIQCPANLVYNPFIKVCDWPENVDCGNKPIAEIENGDNGENDSGGDNNNTGNCDPSEAPAICAAPDSDGVLVAHENCNQFYKCASGLPVSMSCPTFLLYNPATEQCDWPQNVNCGDRIVAGGNDNEGNGADGDNEDSGDNGSNGSENGEGESGSTCNCNPGEAPEICGTPESDGVLIAHEKCDNLYKCANGVPVTLKCPETLLYNPNTQLCDWSENVDCGDRIIDETDSGNGGNGDSDGDNGSTCNCNPEEAPLICASENSDGVLVAHEKCNKFYICAFSIPVAIQCPANLVYNPFIEVCDWPENVDCGDKPIAEIDNGENGDNDSGDDNNNTGNCEPSEAPAICAAPDSDGVLVAHENCNQFYKCANDLPVAMICPTLLLYNPATEQCDWPQNVVCGDRAVSGAREREYLSLNKHMEARFKISAFK